MGQWWIVDELLGGVHTTRKHFDMNIDIYTIYTIYLLFMHAIMGHQMADFWIWVDTSLASSFPILIGIYLMASQANCNPGRSPQRIQHER